MAARRHGKLDITVQTDRKVQVILGPNCWEVEGEDSDLDSFHGMEDLETRLMELPHVSRFQNNPVYGLCVEFEGITQREAMKLVRGCVRPGEVTPRKCRDQDCGMYHESPEKARECEKRGAEERLAAAK